MSKSYEGFLSHGGTPSREGAFCCLHLHGVLGKLRARFGHNDDILAEAASKNKGTSELEEQLKSVCLHVALYNNTRAEIVLQRPWSSYMIDAFYSLSCFLLTRTDVHWCLSHLIVNVLHTIVLTIIWSFYWYVQALKTAVFADVIFTCNFWLAAWEVCELNHLASQPRCKGLWRGVSSHLVLQQHSGNGEPLKDARWPQTSKTPCPSSIMARRCRRMVLLAFLTHVSLELCGFVGSWTAKSDSVKAQPKTFGVHALDTAAALAAASSAVSVLDFVRKQLAWFEAEFARVPLLPGLSPATTVKNHAKKLLELMSAQQTIIPQVVELPEQLIEGTDFEKLMITVLKNNRTGGLSAVHAEPGVGKSVATAMALPNCTQKSAVTVLLQRDFQKNLKGFFRVADVADAVDVASEQFRILKQRGIRLQMVFDNTFDTGVGNDPSLLMGLTRHAFSFGHHLIVITQSEEAAREAGTLNGARTRLWPQQVGHAYRWSNSQAREYLATKSTRVSNVNEMQVEEVLNMTQIPDEFGGWKPVDIDEFLQTGRRPRAPQQGQGRRLKHSHLLVCPFVEIWILEVPSEYASVGGLRALKVHSSMFHLRPHPFKVAEAQRTQQSGSGNSRRTAPDWTNAMMSFRQFGWVNSCSFRFMFFPQKARWMVSQLCVIIPCHVRLSAGLEL